MMLIFSVIVMCSNLYSLCLVFKFLKNTYLKKHFSVVASKHSLCDMEINQFLNIAPMEYNPNGKGTMAPVEYHPIVSSPNGKSMVLRIFFFFELVIVMVEDKKKRWVYGPACTLPVETKYPEISNLVKKMQTHHHGTTCRKKKGVVCRFIASWAPSNEIRIVYFEEEID